MAERLPRVPVDLAEIVRKDRDFMAEVKGVEIRAELRQIKTMADRSVNLILNLPEDCTEQVKVLLDWLGLEVGVVIANIESGQDERPGKSRKIHI